MDGWKDVFILPGQTLFKALGQESRRFRTIIKVYNDQTDKKAEGSFVLRWWAKDLFSHGLTCKPTLMSVAKKRIQRNLTCRFRQNLIEPTEIKCLKKNKTKHNPQMATFLSKQVSLFHFQCQFREKKNPAGWKKTPWFDWIGLFSVSLRCQLVWLQPFFRFKTSKKKRRY